MHSDVLVVGAGPTGLMLANQLKRHGVTALIIDRHSGPAQESRALAVQARTMEIYSHMGLAGEAIALGNRASGGNVWARGKRAARIPIGDIGRDLSPFPYLLILGQDDNERILGKALHAQGIDVQWNTELVGLVQHDDGVTATIRYPDGSTGDVDATWVAGCDGAKSAVRDMSGVAFEGAPYPHVFFVADTTMTGDMVPDELNVYMWRDGFHLFFPLRGDRHWRLVGILPDALRDRDDLTFDEVIPTLRRQAGDALSFQDCMWFSTYRIHHRRATRLRHGRCFLLGDAAHVHSPAGAQGMNTGLQDAYNLAWKLALVVSGSAHSDLLDSYHAERMPVAERLLSTTDRAFGLVVSDNWLAAQIRTRVWVKVVAFAMRFERVRKLAFRALSQIGIRYRESPLSKTMADVPSAAPRAGDRFPWMHLRFDGGGTREDVFAKIDDRCFTLLLFGQTLPDGMTTELGDRLRALVVPADPDNRKTLTRAHISIPAFYLLRPDGHVGLAGTRADADTVRRYVRQRLRIGT